MFKNKTLILFVAHSFLQYAKKTLIHEKNERKLLLPAMCFTQNWVKGGLRAHTPCLSKRRARQHFVRSFDAKLRKGVRVYYCDLKILHPEIVGSKNEDDFLCKKVVKMNDFLNACWFLAGFFSLFCLFVYKINWDTRARFFNFSQYLFQQKINKSKKFAKINSRNFRALHAVSSTSSRDFCEKSNLTNQTFAPLYCG